MEIHPVSKNSLYMKNLNLPQRRSYSTNNSNPAKLSNFKSAATYENAKLSKKHIMQENKGKSGVYRWTNLINGRAQNNMLVLR
jgi:hypothetical protein